MRRAVSTSHGAGDWVRSIHDVKRMLPISLRLPVQLVELIDERRGYHTSRNAYLRRLIAKGLDLSKAKQEEFGL